MKTKVTKMLNSLNGLDWADYMAAKTSHGRSYVKVRKAMSRKVRRYINNPKTW